MVRPRDYQVTAVENVFQELEDVRSTLVVAATGLGKTVTLAFAIKRWLENYSSRVMVVAHREELIFQAKHKIAAIVGIEPAIEMAEYRSEDKTWLEKCPVVITSVQTQNAGPVCRVCVCYACNGKGQVASAQCREPGCKGCDNCVDGFIYSRCDNCHGKGRSRLDCTRCIDGRRLRMQQFDPNEFGLMAIDEAHRSVSATYRRMVKYYAQAKLIGLTATADRADEEALGQVFASVAVDYQIQEAINDGWLVPIDQRLIRVEELDFSECRTTAGDLNEGDLERTLLPSMGIDREGQLSEEDREKIKKEERLLHGMVGPTMDLAGDLPTLIFAASVAHAERVAEIINRHRPCSAVCIHGGTPSDERRHQLQRFRNGEFQFLVNCECYCLDCETEILTSEGWVGINDITLDHYIANWKDGSVFFHKPRRVIVRDRHVGETMVSASSSRRDVRVTGNHRMVYRTWPVGNWKIKYATDLVGKKIQIPVSGRAEPLEVLVEQPAKLTDVQIARAISANSYNLRKHGMGFKESKTEAQRRINIRNGLRRKSPSELSLAECHFIGFFLAEGNRCHLQSGGTSYTIAQSLKHGLIIEWFDNVLSGMSIDFVRQEYPEKPMHGIVQWSFCRGTGFGPQLRNGIFPIEPYIEKDGSYLLWGLDERQFTALIVGLWYGDGDHGLGKVIPPALRIHNSNTALLDLLQAIGCVRGYDVTMRKSHKPLKKNHKQCYTVHFTKHATYQFFDSRLNEETNWKEEKVWCVTTESGRIITRRNGFVVVTGNCEGFDEPRVACIALFRATKSRALYSQMVGRATRPLPGVVDGEHMDAEGRREAIAMSSKSHALILDYVGNSGKHKLITAADLLGGHYSDEVVQMAKAAIAKKSQGGKSADALAELRTAQKQVEERDRQKRRDIVGRAQYTTQSISPFDALDITVTREPGWFRGKKPTQRMAELLQKNGVETAELSFWEAKILIGKIMERRDRGQCTFKQAKLLIKHGYSAEVSFDEAKRLIDELARNNWRRA